MAIVFFSINGTGGGGGGPVSVHTANGISGDGSIATPVILGGNPLNQATSLVLAAFILSITDANTDIEIGNGSVSISTTAAGANGIVEAVGGIAVIGAITAGGQVVLQTDASSTKGVFVKDTISNVGITGVDLAGVSHLFPLNGDPAQYVQAGNITAPTILSAANGLSVVGTQVRLGGALTTSTTIVGGANSLVFNSIVGGTTASIQLFNGILTMRTARGSQISGVVSQFTAGVLETDISWGNTGVLKQISFNGQVGVGIPVTDTADNKGLIGNALFPNSSPNQYAQYGNLATPQNFALVLGSGNRTALTFAVTGGDACIQVNCSLSTSVGAGGGQVVTLAYTDINGNPASKTLCLDGGVAGNFPANTITIEAQNGTNVTISAAGDPGEVYRVVGAIQRFF